MTGVNNDMVQEVKVQSSNFGAEFGSGAVSVSAVTKSGSSKLSGSLYDYVRDWRFAANDRSNSIAGVEKPKSRFIYPGGNIGGPIPLPFSGYNAQQRQAVLLVRARGAAPGRGLGQPSEHHVQRGRADRRSERVPGQSRPESESPGGRADSGLVSRRGHTGARQRPRAVCHAARPRDGQSVPAARTTRIPTTATTTSTAPSSRPTGSRRELRFDWNISAGTKAYIRIARDREDTEGPRGPWANSASELALPTLGLGTNRARSYAGTVVQVLSPTMTHEVLVTFTRQTLDASYQDPSKLRLDALNVDFQGVFSSQSPYVPFNSHWGGSQARQLRSQSQRHLRAQRRAAVRRQAHEGVGRSPPEVRREPRSPAAATERKQRRERQSPLRAVDARRHRQPDR